MSTIVDTLRDYDRPLTTTERASIACEIVDLWAECDDLKHRLTVATLSRTSWKREAVDCGEQLRVALEIIEKRERRGPL